MKQPHDIEQINVMSWLRFPLIIGVVLAHCNLYAIVSGWEGTPPEWPGWSRFIFSELYLVVLPTMVPVLFIISGYFFFRTLTPQKANYSFFIDKYKRRIYSLLIPYIVWNCVALAVQYVNFHIKGTELTLTDCLSGFWDFAAKESNDPANGPLWYIRDLMVVSLATPLIYQLLKKKAVAGIYLLSLAALYATNTHIPVVGFSNDSFMFFSIGAYIAIHKINITRIPHTIGMAMLVLYLPLQLILNRIDDNSDYIRIFFLITSLIKSTAAFYLVSLLFKKNILKPTPKLSNMSFFLYALHGIIIGPVIMVLYKMTGNTDNPLMLLGVYVTTLAIVVGTSFTLYNILTKFTPRIAKIVTGNRR